MNDHRRLGFASVYLAHYHWLKKRLTKALSFGHTALAIGEALGDSHLTVAAGFYLGVTCASSGRFRDAQDFYDMSLTSLGADRGRERCGLMGCAAVMVRGRFAETLAERGEFLQGLAHALEALRIAEELDHPYSLAMACHSLGFLYGARGDLSCATSALERGLELVDRWNLSVWWPSLSMPLGRAYALMGRSAEAIAILRSTIQRYESMYGGLAPNRMINLGEALALAGQLDEALSVARHALTLSREHRERGAEAWALRLLAEIAAHRDGASAVESEGNYRQALTLAEELGMQPLVARCHLGLGELHRARGSDTAQTELTAAAGLFRSMGMTFWFERAEKALA